MGTPPREAGLDSKVTAGWAQRAAPSRVRGCADIPPPGAPLGGVHLGFEGGKCWLWTWKPLVRGEAGPPGVGSGRCPAEWSPEPAVPPPESPSHLFRASPWAGPVRALQAVLSALRPSRGARGVRPGSVLRTWVLGETQGGVWDLIPGLEVFVPGPHPTPTTHPD